MKIQFATTCYPKDAKDFEIITWKIRLHSIVAYDDLEIKRGMHWTKNNDTIIGYRLLIELEGPEDQATAFANDVAKQLKPCWWEWSKLDTPKVDTLEADFSLHIDFGD